MDFSKHLQGVDRSETNGGGPPGSQGTVPPPGGAGTNKPSGASKTCVRRACGGSEMTRDGRRPVPVAGGVPAIGRGPGRRRATRKSVPEVIFLEEYQPRNSISDRYQATITVTVRPGRKCLFEPDKKAENFGQTACLDKTAGKGGQKNSGAHIMRPGAETAEKPRALSAGVPAGKRNDCLWEHVRAVTGPGRRRRPQTALRPGPCRGR